MVKTPCGPEFRILCLRTLAGILPALPVALTAAPVAVPYVESFDGGTSSFSGGSSWSHAGQKYHASVGSGATSGSSVQAPAFPDGFRMETTISGLTGATGDNSCGFGFLGADATFTGGSGAPYYLADVRPATNKVRLIQVAGTNTLFIDSESLSFTLDPAQPFKLAVEGTYDGPVLRMKVVVGQGASQSIHVFDEDTPLAGAYFGFRVRSVSGALGVDYDDFSLRNVTTVAFSGAPSAFALAGTTYSGTVAATTSGPGPVSFTPVQLPAWLTLTDNGDGTAALGGTPPAGTTGTFTLKIQADDHNGPPLVQEFPLKIPAVSGVVISEFVASNDGSFVDEDGDDSDWLEIFNATASPADLGGWKLKDDQTTWTIPQGTAVPAFGHLIVFASDKNRITPNLHANFKLSSSAGGYLALARPDNSIASEYNGYPTQREGASYGLYGDYSSRGILIPATPGAANPDSGYTDFATTPVFSTARGLFATPQAVTLSCPLQGSVISYTLDGSVPTPSNGVLVHPAGAASTPSAVLDITATSVVRAASFKEGYVPSAVMTETYIFPDDIATQASNGVPPAGWPTGTVNGQILDYGVDPDVLNSPANITAFKTALRSLPTFSIVTDRRHLFDPVTGIYVNAYGREKEWERPVSMEMIRPDGTSAFQINCGIRMRGGVSRDDAIPKHSFHFYFRGEYGEGKLHYPLFDAQGAPEFDRIDLRSTQGGKAWHSTGSTAANYMQDEWSRATQGDMGQAHTRSRYVHLYLNGQYWGIYATQERADNAWAASYSGGEKEDYDIIKTYTLPHRVEAADGDAAAWTQLFNAATAGFATDAAYFAVQGRNADGTPSATLKPLVEIDNLIDYMILNMFTSNTDGPVNPGEKNVPKNFYCFRPRDGSAGFRFVAHDFEDTFGGTDVTGHLTTDGKNPIAGATLVYFNPRWLHLQLTQNPRYLRRFGDRVQRNLFNGGALSAAKATERWAAIRAVLTPAIIAESARWGDAKSATPRLPSNWETACDGFYKPGTGTGTLVSRPASFISLLRSTTRGYRLFPATDAPAFSQYGGTVSAGTTLTVSGPSGAQVWYTVNGTDPADAGAASYSGPIPLTAASTTVKARARNSSSGEWSALTEAVFTTLPVAAAGGNLIISEMHYNPSDGSDNRDFIELRNVSPSIVDLTGVRLTNGLTFTFPALTLLPGEHIVVVENDTAFRAFYGTAPRVAGVWDGALSNSGETIALLAAGGGTIESVTYSDSAPWPTAPDGRGPSLVRIHAALPANSAASWRRSTADHGTPGAADAPSLADWLSQRGIPSAQSVAASGLKALAHYASGTSPDLPSTALLPFSRTAGESTFTLRRPISAVDDVRYFLDESTDLSTWPVSTEIDGSSILTGRVSNSDGTETLSVRKVSNGASAFFRLRFVTR